MKRLLLPLALIVAGVALWIMSSSHYAQQSVEDHAVMQSGASSAIKDIFDAEGTNPFDACLPEMPDDGARPLKVKPVLPSLAKAFSDLNATHLEAATALGIKPISDLRSAWSLRRPLVEVKSCREYYVDDLSHSYPYLVPEAATLLKDIGEAFNRELETRGGGDYRVKVTSVLRTPLTVSKLRRVNRNATSESAHQYGTTFDLSYSKFICDSVGVVRTQEDLKNLLAEVVDSLRRQGRLYVKYEYKQGCFHITARK